MNQQPTLPPPELASLNRFTAFVEANEIQAEIIDCGSSTLTVAHAAEAVSCHPDQILKTLLFHDGKGQFAIAIAAGLSRIDIASLLKVSGLESAKLASPGLVLEQLGYPAGGVPPFDLPATVPVFIDNRAAALGTCYAGAGTPRHLVRLDPRVIVDLNEAIVADIIEAR
jgi:prolyl-tRNA editing enzyme YbaK/EbsC (Cys-tRNA(Pro) deacylase)